MCNSAQQKLAGAGVFHSSEWGLAAYAAERDYLDFCGSEMQRRQQHEEPVRNFVKWWLCEGAMSGA